MPGTPQHCYQRLTRCKIRKVDLKGKQMDKTATEFEEALAVLLGRKADRKAMDYSTFKDCLTKMVA